MRTAFLALLLLCVPALHAELKWDTKVLTFRPALTDVKAMGDFTFTNVGKTPVTITSVEPSCDCTSAELAKKTYQPDEKGKITVTFTFGDRSGMKAKVVNVTTDDSKDPVELTMNVYLPESPEITPTYCYWHKDEERESKIISIKVGKDCPFKIVSVFSSDDRIKVDLKTLIKDKEYSLVIKTKTTQEPFSATVDLFSDVPASSPKRFRIHAGVLKN